MQTNTMNPIQLQKQLRDNNTDLQEYFKDIKAWGEEMKRKDESLKCSKEQQDDVPLPRNKIPKKESKEKPPQKKEEQQNVKSKTPKDFSYWEKFDVEAECQKVDNEDTDEASDLSDEIDDGLLDMAQDEKDKGNELVRVGKYDEAIKAYTKAIEYSSYDPVFYANRAFCHLKLKQYKSAEADSTLALQIDAKYVKALYRRAQAHEGLKQYKEAKDDLVQLLVLEPENKEAQKFLDRMEACIKGKKVDTEKLTWTPPQRPVSKFTASRQKQTQVITSKEDSQEGTSGPAFKGTIIERKRTELAERLKKETGVNVADSSKIKLNAGIQWPAGNDVEIVQDYTKLPKVRSQASLRRIEVKECALRQK